MANSMLNANEWNIFIRFAFISLLLFIHGTACGFSYFDNKECAMRSVAVE